MQPLTREQRQVVDSILTGNAVHVTSCAGSGKTTVILACAEAVYRATRKKTLILAYNAPLQNDVRKRIERYFPDESSCPVALCCTTHAAVHNLFVSEDYDPITHPDGSRFICINDKLLDQFLDREDTRIDDIHDEIGLVVLDEAQDANSLTARLFCMVVKGLANLCGRTPKTLLVGDPRQAIYKFRGASVKYLNDPDTHLYAKYTPDLDIKSTQCTLTTTFRAQNTHLTDFVREYSDPAEVAQDWGVPRPFAPGKDTYLPCASCGTGNPVRLFDRVRTPGKQFYRNVASYVHEIERDPNELLHVAMSVKNSNVPVIRLNNALNSFFDIEYRDQRNSECTADKAICSTIHSAKGMERRTVIVHCISGYKEDREFARQTATTGEYDPWVLDNLMHVALTRARQNLVIVWDSRDPYTTFQKLTRRRRVRRHMKYVHYVTPRALATGMHHKNTAFDHTTWTSTEVLQEAREGVFLDTSEMVVETPRANENMAAITGVAMEFMLGHLLKGAPLLTRQSHTAQSYLKCKVYECATLPATYFIDTERAPRPDNFEYHAQHACLYLAAQHRSTKYAYLNERWLTQTQQAIATMATRFQEKNPELTDCLRASALRLLRDHPNPDGIKHQQRFQYCSNTGGVPYTLTGEVDFILNQNAILEVKFVQTLTQEHILQLALYLLGLFASRAITEPVGYLYNMNTNCMIRVRLNHNINPHIILNTLAHCTMFV